MNLSVMLGLAPVVLPTGEVRTIIDSTMVIPMNQKKPNIGAEESRLRALARYKEAFDSLGGKATAYELMQHTGVDRSSAQKWLSKNKGKLVRQYAKVPGISTNCQIKWEWIEDANEQIAA